MLLGLMTLLASAQAGFHQDLATLSAEGAEVGFACGSVSRAVHGLEGVVEAFGDIPGGAERAQWERMRTFLSTDPVDGAFVSDGSFAFGTFEPKHIVVLLHTTLGGSDVAGRFAHQTGGTMAPEGDGFRVIGPDVDVLVTTTTVDGAIRLEQGVPRAPVPRTEEDRVLAALPDLGQGCAVIGGLPAKPPVGGGRFGIYLPLDGAQAARFVMQSPSLVAGSAFAQQAPVALPDVHTPVGPSAWLTIGFSLADADLSTILKDDALKRARTLQKFMPIDAGITMGIFFEGTPGVGAVVPLAKPWPAKKTLRHMRKVLEKVKAAEVTSLGPDRFQAVVDNRTFVVGARTGTIVLSTSAELTDALVANAGTAWLDPSERERAAGWLLAMEVRSVPPFLGADLAGPLWVGVRVEGDLVVGEAVLPLGEAGWAALLKTLKEKAKPGRSGMEGAGGDGGTPL
jgi:hypothetical protein